MPETFEHLIARNKRASFLLLCALVSFTAVLIGLVVTALNGTTILDDPELMLSSTLIGAAVSATFGFISLNWGSGILNSTFGAVRLEPSDDKMLFNVTEELCIAAGMPVPKIYMIPDEAPNAFASGPDPENAMIGITSGLRTKLNREELQAVIAHELAHIKNFDTRLMTLIAVYAGLVVLISDFFLRSYKHGIIQTGKSRGRSPFFIIGFIFSVLFLSWLAPLIAQILQLAVSREREYLADASAIRFTRNPEGLISALKKIALDPADLECDNRATEHLFIINPNLNSRLERADRDSVWSTHPPLIKRIQRLRALTV